ncbi:MAG: ATP-binding protein [Methylococcales bacterium]
MEAIIFIGLQASGKSTFYKANFFNSHLRISNDLLKTKNREAKLIDFCIETNMKMVIDNTNFSVEKRKTYIDKIKPHNFKIIGYYFKIDIARSMKWNKLRKESEVIPDIGILGTYKKIELPTFSEGYNELYYVDYLENKLVVTDWKNEV